VSVAVVRVLLDVSAVPHQPVGAGVYTVALAEGLARHADVDLHLLARRRDERWDTTGASVHRLVPESRPARLTWEQLAAPRAISHLGVDVWHGPHYTMPRALTVPAVVTFHDLTFFDHPEWHERTKVAFFRNAIRHSARHAARLIAVSSHTAERLAAMPFHVAPPVTVVHHGVDHKRFLAEVPPSQARHERAELARRGIEAPYIGFVGTAEPRKNLPSLVHAFAQIAHDHPVLRLVIAGGDGWGTTDLANAIAGCGAASRVLRPGYLPDELIPAFLRNAEVVAYPSFEEGFGLPALEALACGAPLVTSTNSALEEVVGDAAVLADPYSVTELAAALRAALAADAAGLRRRGPQRAAMFEWDRCTDAHVDVYRQAVSQTVRV
jgi:glycosyltransferase involved in cell wall biosynthesis